MKCPKCNQEVEKWDEEQTNKIGECSSCRFWNEQLYYDIHKRKPHKVAIIDNVHYIIGPENDPDPFRGFGGAKFQIEFFDGTRIETTNLWCQGDVPPYWKEKFPNNAKFSNDLKWRTLKSGTQILTEDDDILPF